MCRRSRRPYPIRGGALGGDRQVRLNETTGCGRRAQAEPITVSVACTRRRSPGTFERFPDSGSSGNAVLQFFYFAAKTYSTLGYGDLVPVGALRVVASVEALNGLMLLSWSGAFLFGVLDRDGRAHKERH
jgi:Ion channel